MTRPELLDYLAARGIDLPLTKKNPYSIDENLWGRAIECGELEDPWAAAPGDAYAFTTNPEDAPDEAEEVVVGFEAGIPVSLDGKPWTRSSWWRPSTRSAALTASAASTWWRTGWSASRAARSTKRPGPLSLIMAHGAMEDLTLTRELQHFKTGIDQRLTELIYDGLWFSPLAEALRAFIDESQKHVSGRRPPALLQGLVQRGRPPLAQFPVRRALATYGSGDTFSHESAVGFIELWGLPVEVWARAAPGSL